MTAGFNSDGHEPDHDDQIGEIYPTMLNERNYIWH